MSTDEDISIEEEVESDDTLDDEELSLEAASDEHGFRKKGPSDETLLEEDVFLEDEEDTITEDWAS